MEHGAFLRNAAATFTELELNGPAADPFPFGEPRIGRAERVYGAVVQTPAGKRIRITDPDVIVYERHADGRPPQRAYLVGPTIMDCIYGSVRFCHILCPRNDVEVPWEVTVDKAAVKMMSLQMIRESQRTEDPMKEVAAMQYVGRDGQHPHVMGVLDVLQDVEYLFLFMPYCSRDFHTHRAEQVDGRFQEPMARYWFRQILEALSHLQKVGICHRDLSLENLVIDDFRTAVVIDLGMCLRVPYDDNGEMGNVADVSAGTLRRLIRPLVACGKKHYMSPEILNNEEPFDGFAIDLWAAGVILFYMLVGLAPWNVARKDDPRFRMVTNGGLAKMVRDWMRPISALAADLLQNMLQEDPRQRLSLAQVRKHPWVLLDEIDVPEVPRTLHFFLGAE